MAKRTEGIIDDAQRRSARSQLGRSDVRELGVAPPAAGGGGCPEIKGERLPDPSYVQETLWDVNGCRVPLREGVGTRPSQRGDFGYRHIVARYQEGARNHETTNSAKRLWQNALLRPGAALGKSYVCYFARYKVSAGSKRTMLVFVDYKSYRGYRYKGIVTAYWVNGHRSC